MTADQRCVMPECGAEVLPLSVFCPVHRPTIFTGVRVSEGLPGFSHQELYPNGAPRLLGWEFDETASHLGGPSRVRFDPDGIPDVVEWRVDGQRHREDGPAVLRLESNGWNEKYFRNGLLDREDGPAAIRFRFDGSVREVAYFAGPLGFHRLDGPAAVVLSADGSVSRERWFVEEVEFPEADEVAAYTAAIADGAPVEWARSFALGRAVS